MTATLKAPMLVLGPSLTIEYRTVVVPVKRTGESEEALVAAARLAAQRGATVAIVHVIEVPLSLPLDARLPEQQDDAEALLDDAQALVESYGVRAVTRLLRARKAGPAIVEEARRRNAELVLLGAPRQAIAGRRALFGGTVDYVLREAPCRVLIAAGKQAA
jgi:APA family basic amino acid/polyamine antiporter